MARTILTTDVDAVAARLRAGGVVAFPTETVYGLGAHATNIAAVRRVFAIKRRPAEHPLIVHIPEVAALDDWAREIPDAARRLAARFWPGPLTLILRRRPRVPDVVTGGQDYVGLRVPNHPLARALLGALGDGIAAPSANRYGRVSATRAEHVLDELGEEPDLILDGGPCSVGIESTIVSFADGIPRLLRPGAITPAMLAHETGPLEPSAATAAVRAPGSHAAHYAPATPLEVLATQALWIEAERLAAKGRRVVVLSRGPAPRRLGGQIHVEIMSDEPEAFGRDLYAALRRADARGAARLLVEAPPRDEAWLAVADRLRRAAAGLRPMAT